MLEAVCRIAARGGLPAATFREIASEAGTSVRVVQYYFGTKAELLRKANDFVLQRSSRRLLAAIEALGTDPSPRDVVVASMRSFLPRDREARSSIVLFYAFYATELTSPSKGAGRMDRGVGLPRLISHQIMKAQQSGVIRTDLDAEQEAMVLFLLVPTIASAVVTKSMTLEDAEELIDYSVTKVFGPSGAMTPRPRSASNLRAKR